jgi:NAD(P)-dependent dehydrogenase (short-subunit alcohol dehydrogenase family)
LFCRVFADADIPRRVINVSSGAAQTALSGEAVYCVAKAGIELLTLTLAADQQVPSFPRDHSASAALWIPICSCMRAPSRRTSCQASDLFQEFHRAGRLVAPAVVASKIASRLVLSDVEHGRTYSYQDL